MSILKNKLNRMLRSASNIKEASNILLKAQETLNKASERLALAAVKLKMASDSIRLSSFSNKIYLEDKWEVTVILQANKSYIAVISVKNTKTDEFFKSLRFDTRRQVFFEDKFPLLSEESKATLAQALSVLSTEAVEKIIENKDLN